MFDDIAASIAVDAHDLGDKLTDIAELHAGMINLAQKGAFISADPYELTYQLGQILYGDTWVMPDKDE